LVIQFVLDQVGTHSISHFSTWCMPVQRTRLNPDLNLKEFEIAPETKEAMSLRAIERTGGNADPKVVAHAVNA
jgi:hypothetical protein